MVEMELLHECKRTGAGIGKGPGGIFGRLRKKIHPVLLEELSLWLVVIHWVRNSCWLRS